jgi:orotate phosphoribosyltransferase
MITLDMFAVLLGGAVYLLPIYAEDILLVGATGVGWLRAAPAVGGLTLGADPVAYAIATASWGTDLVIDGFSVRKEAKGHGAGRVIEGCFSVGDEVVIVEDVITTGGSAQRAIEAVTLAGGVVLGVLAVVDRGEGGREVLEAEGREVVALVEASALLLQSLHS